MSDFSDGLAALEKRLEGVTGAAPDWRKASRLLDFAAELAVDAFDRGAEGDLEALGRSLQRIYGDVAVDHDLDDETPTASSFSFQLLGYARFLAVATVHRKSLTAAEEQEVRDKLSVGILSRIQDAAPQPLSGVELAGLLGVSAAQIARKLPLMRTANLVRSWPVGRLMVNALTPLGVQMLKELRPAAPAAVPEPEAEPARAVPLRAISTDAMSEARNAFSMAALGRGGAGGYGIKGPAPNVKTDWEKPRMTQPVVHDPFDKSPIPSGQTGSHPLKY